MYIWLADYWIKKLAHGRGLYLKPALVQTRRGSMTQHVIVQSQQTICRLWVRVERYANLVWGAMLGGLKVILHRLNGKVGL